MSAPGCPRLINRVDHGCRLEYGSERKEAGRGLICASHIACRSLRRAYPGLQQKPGIASWFTCTYCTSLPQAPRGTLTAEEGTNAHTGELLQHYTAASWQLLVTGLVQPSRTCSRIFMASSADWQACHGAFWLHTQRHLGRSCASLTTGSGSRHSGTGSATAEK